VEYFHTGKTTRRGTEFGGATGQFAKEVKKETTDKKLRVKRTASFKV
jgi:hypothetical protein